jgi:hypothetical protein
MALKRLYRVKRDHIKVIPKISTYHCEVAFQEGYVFIQEEGSEDIYMLHSRTNKKELEITWLEKVEVVEGNTNGQG